MMRFRVLDSWRGICALVVALFHFMFPSHIVNSPLIHNSWLLVDFFFVLSGFVIGHAYADKFAGWASLLPFMIRRFGRVYPLHFFTLMVFVAFEFFKMTLAPRIGLHFHDAPFTGHASLAALAANLALIQAMGIHLPHSWNEPSWSISVEFYTYLLFGLFCIFVSRRMRTAAIVAIAAAGALLVVTFSQNYMHTQESDGFARCVFGFFTGYLTYEMWRRAGAPARFLRGSVPEFVIVLAIGTYISIIPDLSVYTMAAPLLFALAIYIFAHESGAVSRLLQTRLFVGIGLLSYSIYMDHFFIATNFTSFLSRWTHSTEIQNTPASPAPSHLLFLGDFAEPFYVAAVLAAAYLTYRYVEVPARDYFNRQARRIEHRPRMLAEPALETDLP